MFANRLLDLLLGSSINLEHVNLPYAHFYSSIKTRVYKFDINNWQLSLSNTKRQAMVGTNLVFQCKKTTW